MNAPRSPKSPPAYTLDVHEDVFDEMRVHVSGLLYVDNAGAFRREILDRIAQEPMRNVCVDLSGVEYMDSAGAAVLGDIYATCVENRTRLKLTGLDSQAQDLIEKLELREGGAFCPLSPKKGPGLVEQIGGGAEGLYRTAGDIVIFIGGAVEALFRDVTSPRSIKWDPPVRLIERSGPDALPIVLMLSFLMGAILAFQAAIQLRKFGANIFVADLVSVAICLEMGPLMTAIIVAGRSGAGFAAHIGTMRVTQEIDALRVMGVDPVRYLVSPRILALALMMPCLTILADIVGTVGGAVVSAFALELTPVTYFNQVHKVLDISDIMKGLTKSFVFGIEIALIGCLRGFQVRGGAESVGSATTSAVVTCIFVITLTDAVFAVLFHYVRFL